MKHKAHVSLIWVKLSKTGRSTEAKNVFLIWFPQGSVPVNNQWMKNKRICQILSKYSHPIFRKINKYLWYLGYLLQNRAHLKSSKEERRKSVKIREIPDMAKLYMVTKNGLLSFSPIFLIHLFIWSLRLFFVFLFSCLLPKTICTSIQFL
jgi:hypothetical protein